MHGDELTMSGTPTVHAPVLVVDDDLFSRRLVVDILRRAGHTVHEAQDGAEALRIAGRIGSRIIITDLEMPNLNGMELCRALRSSEEIGFCYIIMLTATRAERAIVQALEAGADEFLSKPVSEAELLARLSPALRILHLESQIARSTRALHKANAELALLNSRLELTSSVDELTGVRNRRHALQRLSECWNIAQRTDQPLSVLMIDLDHFKACNDQHGHRAGDQVLCGVAACLQETVRICDVVGRVGGEEFLIVCPATPRGGAHELAERLRGKVAQLELVAGTVRYPLTVSIGVAERSDADVGFESLVRRADDALYRAKRGGRNRVEVDGNCSPVPVAH